MGGDSLNIFKEMLYFHVDLTSKLHNEEKQTFIKLSRRRCLSGDHSSVRPQHLPCEQLLGETTNAPPGRFPGVKTRFSHAPASSEPSPCPNPATNGWPQSCLLYRKESLKFFKKLNKWPPKLAPDPWLLLTNSRWKWVWSWVFATVIVITGPKDTALNVHMQEG